MPLLDLLFTMLWFFLFVAWIWLVISVFVDIFRSDDLSGWGKALWALVVIVVPLLGVLIYLIARGGKMQERARQQAQARDAATFQYIRETAETGSTGDELAKLAKLRDEGVLTPEEFEAQKAKVLG